MIGRPIAELCSDSDESAPLYPLTVRYVTEHLHHGKFRGLGFRHGRRWLLDDSEIEQVKERLRPPLPDLDAERPSGLSPRSRTFPRTKSA